MLEAVSAEFTYDEFIFLVCERLCTGRPCSFRRSQLLRLPSDPRGRALSLNWVWQLPARFARWNCGLSPVSNFSCVLRSLSSCAAPWKLRCPAFVLRGGLVYLRNCFDVRVLARRLHAVPFLVCGCLAQLVFLLRVVRVEVYIHGILLFVARRSVSIASSPKAVLARFLAPRRG